MIRFSLHKKLKASDGELNLQVTCEIKEGQLATIYGGSGAGKTSILRMLAGLLKPDRGFVEIKGNTCFDSEKKINISPRKRKIGFVFQDYVLFPNMTVKENLLYAAAGKKDHQIIDVLMDKTELGALQDRKPDTLSGGQQQRVALARALVRKPDILLLDEPLSALDENMRIKLQDYILDIHNEFNITTILVSHDISEIFRMSQKIYVLQDGRIKKEGTPQEIFFDRKLSGKYRLTGSILNIRENDVVNIVSVLVGQNIIKVIATSEETQNLKQGDKVMIVSKAFNPLIIKMND